MHIKHDTKIGGRIVNLAETQIAKRVVINDLEEHAPYLAPLIPEWNGEVDFRCYAKYFEESYSGLARSKTQLIKLELELVLFDSEALQ